MEQHARHVSRQCDDGHDTVRSNSILLCHRLTNADNIELETTLQKLLLDLAGDAVETDVALGVDAGGRHFGRVGYK